MNNILLIRHGVPDYQNSLVPKNLAGITIGRDSVGLSSIGIAECEVASKTIVSFRPKAIISSPYTRALQSAIIYSSQLIIPIQVDTNFSEWLTSCSFTNNGRDEYEQLLEEVTVNKGIYNTSCKYLWESIYELTDRAVSSISHYLTLYERIVIVSHKMLIYQLTGKSLPFCGYVETNLDEITQRIKTQ